MSQDDSKQQKPISDPKADKKPLVDKEKLEKSIKDKQKVLDNNQTVTKNEQTDN